MTDIPFGTVDEAVAWAREHGGRWSTTLAEALASDDEPPIEWAEALADDDTSDEQARRAAVLAGAVVRRRIGLSPTCPEEILLAELAYGAALATPQGQRCLCEGRSKPLKAHAYACILLERHGHVIDVRTESGLLWWLLGRLGHAPLLETAVRMRRLRDRRHERLADR